VDWSWNNVAACQCLYCICCLHCQRMLPNIGVLPLFISCRRLWLFHFRISAFVGPINLLVATSRFYFNTRTAPKWPALADPKILKGRTEDIVSALSSFIANAYNELHYVSKNVPPFYFLIIRRKWTYFNIFCVCTESIGNFTSDNDKVANLTWIMSPHYLVKNNKSDAACRIVDHTRTAHQPAIVRATHLWARLL